MKVKLATASALYVALGLKSASRWDAQKMQEKINKVSEFSGIDEVEIADPTLAKLLARCLVANSKDEEITIIEGDAETETKPAKKPAAAEKPATKPAKKATKPAVAEEEDEEEEEETVPVRKPKPKDAKPAKKGAKPADKAAKPEKKPKPAKKPGFSMVRETNAAPRYCGVVLKEFGLDIGVTEEMIKRVGELTSRANRHQDVFNLRNAWHAIRGYLNGAVEETEEEEADE